MDFRSVRHSLLGSFLVTIHNCEPLLPLDAEENILTNSSTLALSDKAANAIGSPVLPTLVSASLLIVVVGRQQTGA